MIETINKLTVNDLYCSKNSGVTVFKAAIEPEKLIALNEYVNSKKELFEVKREKYIANNQLVSLLYRGPFDTSSLNDTVFGEILNHYKELRDTFNTYSEIPFETGTSIEVKLIHYPISDLGVGIHRDLSSNINMVVFYNLEGNTTLKTYDDKSGSNPIDHFLEAGDISIMRAPRSTTEPDIRPNHGVEKVLVPRTVLVIREINEELEKETNKDNWRGF